MAPRAPSGPLWLHEIKHDGFRIIARKDSRRTRLYDRLGNDLTQCFPLIAGAMALLPSCTIDGEAVAYDDSDVPSFDPLRCRQQGDRTFLHAFDLALQLLFPKVSESMGNHDSKIVDAGGVD